eukprot:747306-Hanusia_phi.AAC.1
MQSTAATELRDSYNSESCPEGLAPTTRPNPSPHPPHHQSRPTPLPGVREDPTPVAIQPPSRVVRTPAPMGTRLKSHPTSFHWSIHPLLGAGTPSTGGISKGYIHSEGVVGYSMVYHPTPREKTCSKPGGRDREFLLGW